VYSKLGWIVAVAMAVFPFVALVVKFTQTEAIVSVLVVAAICAILFVVVLIASKITVAPEPASSAPPREPQPPLAWNWDGVDRQPEPAEQPKADEQVKR
jgi:hypothetical protein